VTFLEPLGAAGFLAVAALVLLHLRTRRRRPVPVGTLFLWRRLPATVTPTRFRADLLFAVRAALLLALTGALLRPALEAPLRADGGALVLVLDVSASMQAREPGGTRFDLARRRAAALAAGATDVLLVTAADRARVALRWTADAGTVRRELETMVPLDLPTRLAPALGLALAEAAARPGTRIAVLTDLPPAASGLDAGALARVHWVQIGRTDDNVALVGLAVDAPPFQDVRAGRATAVVRNYAARARAVTLDATIDGVPWTRRTVVLGPRATVNVVLDGPRAPGTLAVRLAANDALAADDVAFARVPAPATLDATVVGDGTVLAAALARVAAATGGRVDRIPSAAWTGAVAEESRLVVFDRTAPGPPPPGVPALYVEPPQVNPICPGAGETLAATAVDWDAAHPAVAGREAALATLALPRAQTFAAPPWGAAVAFVTGRGPSGALLVAGERDGSRVACLGAGLDAPPDSDALPLLVLLLGTVAWLEDAGEPVVATGTPVGLRPAASGDAPDGVRVAAAGSVAVAERAGIHHLGERVLAASLLDDRESDIGREGDREWPADAPPAPARSGAPHEIGRWLVALALGLLLAEAALARRRA
jgi:hypothetical protein